MFNFIRFNQHEYISEAAPIFGCGLKEKLFTVFSYGKKSKLSESGKHPFISIDKYYKPLTEKQLEDISLSSSDIPNNLSDIQQVFAMDSLRAKCGHITFSFMQLLILSFDSYQLTYKGEPIVGWSPQYGNILPDFFYPLINHTQLSDIYLIPQVLDEWNSDTGISYCLEVTAFTGAYLDASHAWLSFSVEDGRRFDLDLSAFQYGILEPNPLITSVSLSNYEVALNGTCERKFCYPPNKAAQTDMFLMYGSQLRGDDRMHLLILSNIEFPRVQELFQDENKFWLIRGEDFLYGRLRKLIKISPS